MKLVESTWPVGINADRSFILQRMEVNTMKKAIAIALAAAGAVFYFKKVRRLRSCRTTG